MRNKALDWLWNECLSSNVELLEIFHTEEDTFLGRTEVSHPPALLVITELHLIDTCSSEFATL